MTNRKSPQRNTHYSSRRRSMRKKDRERQLLIKGCMLALVLFLILVIILTLKSCGRDSSSPAETSQEGSALSMPSGHLTVNGISLDGLTFDQAVDAIIAPYSWSMTAVCEEKTVPVSNLIEIKTRRLLEDACQNTQGGSYTFDFQDMEDVIQEETAALASRLATPPKNSTLDHFDSQTGKFVFTEGSAGLTVDQDQLSQDLRSALKNKQYDAVITAYASEAQPEADSAVQSKYKTLATFTTTTTNNAKRNTNVKLAADALNGTILQPGEEFSFNAVVGERTAEKGYQAAAAYNSGEVVQELGGGVCQISSTLYRVAFQSGMEITYRRSHTFEPNYVTPGQDATISWELPDFRFVNTSEGAVGIRASYSNQKATVSIYGIPVLEEGITWDLYSEKVKELDPPEPTYIEDPTLDPGTEKLDKAGSQGSTWVTYKIVSKDGVEIERVKDHEKTYLGHAPVIRRNTGTEKLSPDETESPAETPAPTVDGMPADYVPGQADPEEHKNTSSESRPAEEGRETSEDKGSENSSKETSSASVPETAAPAETSSAENTVKESSAETSAPVSSQEEPSPVPQPKDPVSAGPDSSGQGGAVPTIEPFSQIS